MAITTQDFENLLMDFTAIVEADGAAHNSLVTAANPKEDTNGDGKGLILITHDTALNTPVVPDPTGADVKWKRYMWVRVPFSTAESLTPIAYAWNEDQVEDALYLKWIPIIGDITTVTASIHEVDLKADTAIEQSADAQTDAQTANANAADALNKANTALASVNSNTSSIAELTEKIEFSYAYTKGDRTIDELLVGTAAYQKIRSNSANAALEFYSEQNTIAILQETTAYNVSGGNAVAGKNTRILNATNSNLGNIVTLDAATGYVTIAKTGYYRIKAWASAFIKYTKTPTANVLTVSANDVIIGRGAACQPAETGTTVSSLECVVALNAGNIIKLDHYWLAPREDGLGSAHGIAAAGVNVHAQLIIEKL